MIRAIIMDLFCCIPWRQDSRSELAKRGILEYMIKAGDTPETIADYLNHHTHLGFTSRYVLEAAKASKAHKLLQCETFGATDVLIPNKVIHIWLDVHQIEKIM